MISRLIAKATLVGVAASLAMAAPAAAATKPTLEEPPVTVGFNPVTLKGKADPGATLQLYETAYVWPKDMAPAKDYSNNNGPVTTKADSQGNFSFQRDMDSGHWFQVVADGDTANASTAVAAAVQQRPFFASSGLLASPSNNTVTATIVASPGQPDLDVELQRLTNGTWTKIAEGVSAGNLAQAEVTATGVPAGVGSFRAFVHGDPENNVLPGPGATFELTVQGTATNPSPSTSASPSPSPSTSPKPTPTPTPTKTTPPKPVVPAPGSVVFTRIQYDSPGIDSGTNGSLNTEWVKLTNKTKSTINLRDWTVRDYVNHVYKFYGNYYLGAGQSVFVLTGKGKDVTGKRYWNRAGKGGYIWNNASEIAYLKGPTGKNVDICMWKSVGRGYTTC